MRAQPLHLSLLALSGAVLAGAASADSVDFEGLQPGLIVTSVTSVGGVGPIAVGGDNPNLAGQNAAIVFDSANPTGGDDDLGTPHADFGGPGQGAGGAMGAMGENAVALGNLLIVAENLNVDGNGIVTDPDDSSSNAAALEFDFSAVGSARLNSVSYIDFDNGQQGSFELFDLNDASLGVFPMVAMGNNGVGTAQTGGVDGVVRMVVQLGGSGALVGFDFNGAPTVYCDSAVNSTGVAATINYSGDLSIGINGFFLDVAGLPPNKPGYMFYGLNQQDVPFGDGVSCIAGGIFRYKKVPSTGPNGVISIPLDFSDPVTSTGPGQIFPGIPYYFQCWYRDPAGVAGFNTSGAICVTFNP